MQIILKELEKREKRYMELSLYLMDEKVIKNPSLLSSYARERAELEESVHLFRRLKKIEELIEENRRLKSDRDVEIKELARMEEESLEKEREEIIKNIKSLLFPPDPQDKKNAILEIRAGTGGDEAALFAADLFRMYSRYAERIGWKMEVLSTHSIGRGGFKEIISLISGKNVFGEMKYESGVHRVQRVPVTESQGRIHTSTVTVAVLPEAEDVDVVIDEKDLRVDLFRASGPGGQHVNKTESAVRIVHIPTGITVSCQDEKSQHKNKARALKILRARLLKKTMDEMKEERDHKRRIQIGSGERSEKIRTYNFPQGRVTDHRIGVTFHRLEEIMDGDIGDIIEAVRHQQGRR